MDEATTEAAAPPSESTKAATATATVATEIRGTSIGVMITPTNVDEAATSVVGTSTDVHGSAVHVATTPTLVHEVAPASAVIASAVHGTSTGVAVPSILVDEAANVAGSFTGVCGLVTRVAGTASSVDKAAAGLAVTPVSKGSFSNCRPPYTQSIAAAFAAREKSLNR